VALGVPRPRISAGFKTVKSPALAMPKPPTVPKAGRLAPTGGRVGGTPGPKAPRIPKPAMPKPFGKSEGDVMGEREYLLSKAVPLGPGVTRRKIKGGIKRFAREMDPKRNPADRFFARNKIAQVGDGAAALAAQRGMTYQRDIVQGVRGLFGKGLPSALRGIARTKEPVWDLTAAQRQLMRRPGVPERLMANQIGRSGHGKDMSTAANYALTSDLSAKRKSAKYALTPHSQRSRLERAHDRTEARRRTLAYRAEKEQASRGKFLP